MRVARHKMSTMLAAAPARSQRLLEGRCNLMQPHEQRPQGIIDQLTGKPVRAYYEDLGWELPNVDLSEHLTDEDIETIEM